jgi:hypothetical protein
MDISVSNLSSSPDLWKREISHNDTHVELSLPDKVTSAAQSPEINSQMSPASKTELPDSLAPSMQHQQEKRNLFRATQIEGFRDAHVKLKTNLLNTVDPPQVESNLLRVGGSQSKASAAQETEQSVTPQCNNLSRRIALNFHEKLTHQSRVTMNVIRSAGDWISGRRRDVASSIDKCVTFAKHHGTSKGHNTANPFRKGPALSDRFTSSSAFHEKT